MPAHVQALEALVDTAFLARFDLDRITKERSAVVAEAQMMNTMEYRVDCALLRSLHRECSLGSRFPIGRVEQVRMHRLHHRVMVQHAHRRTRCSTVWTARPPAPRSRRAARGSRSPLRR